MRIELETWSADETRDVGQALASLLRPRDTIVLTGDLGAGKTTMVQGIGRGLGVEDHVASPTFTLVREYAGRLDVAHVDVYRLERMQDVVDLAIDELGGRIACCWSNGGTRSRNCCPPTGSAWSSRPGPATRTGDGSR